MTRRIQELWMAMQDSKQREAFVPCAERIRVAVAELTAIFPQVRPAAFRVTIVRIRELVITFVVESYRGEY